MLPLVGNAKFYSMSEKRSGGRGNALEAICAIHMKRTLKAVVEVKYTTGRLSNAG
jgi:hypothetical protein